MPNGFQTSLRMRSSQLPGAPFGGRSGDDVPEIEYENSPALRLACASGNTPHRRALAANVFFRLDH
jgi:hypothetical protein